MQALPVRPKPNPKIPAFVQYEDGYVQPLTLRALHLSNHPFQILTAPPNSQRLGTKLLQISSFEAIDHEFLLKQSETFMANSYTTRKALIRKHFLISTVRHWTAKHEDSVLKSCMPWTVNFNLDYSEFLEDALMEGDGMELYQRFENNEGKAPNEREWFILKPSMADRGQGIKLFSTFEELKSIFEEWEEEQPNDEDEDEGKAGAQETKDTEGADTMPSQLRDFVVSKYIRPLLLPEKQNRKFHIRCYVVAVGALNVYVYQDMLALFAPQPYASPSVPASDLNEDLRAHLTNTCLQDGSREGSVEKFWELSNHPKSALRHGEQETIFDTICEATAELFRAAIAQPTRFQPLPNAFELYGVDWLIGYDEGSPETMQPYLLEVNAFPDLKQTGDKLEPVIQGLWNGIVDVAIAPFFGLPSRSKNSDSTALRKVLDEDMRRR